MTSAPDPGRPNRCGLAVRRQTRELLPAVRGIQKAEAERQDQNLTPGHRISAVDAVPVRAVRDHLDGVASSAQCHNGFGYPVSDHVEKRGWNGHALVKHSACHDICD
jgi:hypothetical protein